MAITEKEFQLMKDYLREHSGITLGDGKEYLLESRLTTLMVQNGCETFTDLHKMLQAGTEPLRVKVIDAMTTNETLWFRDDSFFSVFEKEIVPRLIKRASMGKVRIWSAACSTGQEPYSIAMLIDHALGRSPSVPNTRFEILATDLSPSAIFMATSARYSQLALSRGMRPDFKDRYFNENGLAYELDQKIRAMVTFKQFNLMDSFALLGKFDIILCRNVLIYFSDELKKSIYGKLSTSLLPDGMLALGSSESPRGITDALTSELLAKTAFYRPAQGSGGHSQLYGQRK